MSAFMHSVISLWRYPVKSMLGEELNALTIGDSGVIGDRAYALVDQETGKVVSAKNPKKWPDIFSFRSAYPYCQQPQAGVEIPPVWITLPGGENVRSDAEGVDETLSAALSRSVSLKKQAAAAPTLEQYWPEREGQGDAVTDEAMAGAAPEGTFFDYAMVHVLTTGTLRCLQELYPKGRIEVRRFRPNLVIETGPDQVDFVENTWVGRTLRIGDSVRLQVTDPCPRCVMPTLAQGDLPRDPDIMRTMMKNTVHVPFVDKALPSIGVYARVITGGTVHRRDPVAIE